MIECIDIFYFYLKINSYIIINMSEIYVSDDDSNFENQNNLIYYFSLWKNMFLLRRDY